jgi:hypothetical protein
MGQDVKHAICISNCRTFALIYNLHHIGLRALHEFTDLLASELKHLGGSLRPQRAGNTAQRRESLQYLVPRLREARDEALMGSEPTMHPDLWKEFQAATTKVMNRYQEEVLSQYVGIVEADTTELIQQLTTMGFAHFFQSSQLLTPLQRVFLVPEIGFPDMDKLQQSIEEAKEVLKSQQLVQTQQQGHRPPVNYEEMSGTDENRQHVPGSGQHPPVQPVTSSQPETAQ